MCVVNEPEKALQGLQLLALKDALTQIGHAGNALARERLLVDPGGSAHRAQQNHNVPRLDGAQRVALANRRAPVQKFPQPPGYEGSLGPGLLRGILVALLVGTQAPQLHSRVRQLRHGHTLAQRLLLGVGKVAYPRGHTGRKHGVCRL